MDFRFTEEQEAFRKEFTAWLKDTIEDLNRIYSPEFTEDLETWKAEAKDFQRRLFDAGYSSIHYPKEYGGQGGTVEKEMIVLETIEAVCPDRRRPFISTLGLIAPTILKCGTEAQKMEYLPKMLDGTHIWAQGFSEPNAGSDVVNVSTRAVKRGENYVLNGQKVWTSFAHMADYAVMVVRTDPDVPKHKGLSYLIMDMKSPGLEVRPIVQIDGGRNFNEVFLEDVKIPAHMIIGKEGEGWMIAIATLMFERAMSDIGKAGYQSKFVAGMFEQARMIKRSGMPLISDPGVRQQLGQAWTEVMVVKSHAYRNFSALVEKGIPGPEGSIGKLLWSETGLRLAEANMQLQGPFNQLMKGSALSVNDGYAQDAYLRSKGYTIEAGTSEIQRNIIGERVLGLPKDATRVSRDKGERK